MKAWVQSFGAKATVESPPELRREIEKNTGDVEELYEHDLTNTLTERRQREEVEQGRVESATRRLDTSRKTHWGQPGMRRMTFEDFFRSASGQDRRPYPFQRRFAEAETLPTLRIPTGLGKTATVILGWLYRLGIAGEETRKATPPRLVYCLPMRTLVEQTRRRYELWLETLAEEDRGPRRRRCPLVDGASPRDDGTRIQNRMPF